MGLDGTSVQGEFSYHGSHTTQLVLFMATMVHIYSAWERDDNKLERGLKQWAIPPHLIPIYNECSTAISLNIVVKNAVQRGMLPAAG